MRETSLDLPNFAFGLSQMNCTLHSLLDLESGMTLGVVADKLWAELVIITW